MNDAAWREEARSRRHQSGSVIGLSPEAAGVPLPGDPPRAPAREVSLARPVCHRDSCPACCGRPVVGLHPAGLGQQRRQRQRRLPARRGRSALAGATGRQDPVTVTARYLSPGRPGSVRIAAQVLKQGRRFVTGTATMFCGGRPLLAVLGSSVTCHRPRVPSSSRAHAPSCPRQSSVSACIRPAPSPRSRAGPVCGCTPRMPPSRPGANPDMR